MEEIVLASSPLTESWFPILLAFLCLLLSFSFIVQPYNIAVLFRKGKDDDRSNLFDDQTRIDIRAIVSQVIFVVCTWTLCSYLLMYGLNGTFRLLTYLKLLACVSLFFALKYLLLLLLGYVFFGMQTFTVYMRMYWQLLLLISMLGLPLCLFSVLLPEIYAVYPLILLGLLLFGAVIMLLVDIFQLFFHKMVASFYILLYLCTLEIIPFWGLFFLLKKIVVSV